MRRNQSNRIRPIAAVLGSEAKGTHPGLLSDLGVIDKLVTSSRPAVATSAASLHAVATPARKLGEGASKWGVVSTSFLC
jgi:hypothetical protein